MKTYNNSFIQMPLNLNDNDQLRNFLFSLLEKLNELQGNIGNNKAIRLNQYNIDKSNIDTNINTNKTNIGINKTNINTNKTNIGINKTNINTNKTNIASITDELLTFSKTNGSRNYTAEVKYDSSVNITNNYSLISKKYVDDNFTNNPIQSSISSLNQDKVTRDSSYNQTNAQTVADNLKTVADKVDSILSALQAANIIT